MRVRDETGLLGSRIYTEPDSSDLFKGVPPMHAVVDKQRIVFRESEWPAIQEALKNNAKDAP